MKDINKYFEIAKEAISEASEFLKENFGDTKEMHEKEKNHYGIDDDIQTNTIIENHLRKYSHEVGIYSEEGERDIDSEMIWVIDPIDGTSNYRVGIPQFVTQLCLLVKNEPVIAVIDAPALDMSFTAKVNEGCYLNDKKITVSEIVELNKSMFTVNKGRSNEEMSRVLVQLSPYVRTVRCFGSMGIDLAYVASGKSELLLSSGGDLYDFAPGVLLVREAGGKVVNLKGKKWTTKNTTILAGNSSLVDQTLSFLN